MKNVLIINGHPDSQSLCNQLAITYKQAAESAGAECRLINLYDLSFNPILNNGYRKRTELEPDLLDVQQEIVKAGHLVLVYPNWWGTYPALLKGFIDRVFLPGFAFRYTEKQAVIDKLLKGKSARLIVTMDSPTWYYSLFIKKPGHNSMKKAILEFCGIKPVRITSFSPIKHASEKKRIAWIGTVEKLGKQLK